MPRARGCGRSETVPGGYRVIVDAFGFLSSWRRPCFAGFVSRLVSACKQLFYRFHWQEETTTVGCRGKRSETVMLVERLGFIVLGVGDHGHGGDIARGIERTSERIYEQSTSQTLASVPLIDG